jgi:tetratricopeptide (TPR) repeat protein
LIVWALPLSWGIRHLPILRGFSEKLGLPSISPVLVPLFLAAGLFFMLPLLNLLPKADEIAEFLLAVSIAGLALDQLITLQPADVRETSGASWLGFFAYLSVLTVILVVFFPTPEMLQSRLNNFAAQVYPRNGLPGQAQTIFLYLQSHPEMQTERTPLNHARFLMRQGDLEGAKALLDEQLALHRAEILAADGNLQRRRYLAELDAAAAEVNFLLGNIPLAAEYINEALTLDSELAVPENLKNLVP